MSQSFPSFRRQWSPEKTWEENSGTQKSKLSSDAIFFAKVNAGHMTFTGVVMTNIRDEQIADVNQTRLIDRCLAMHSAWQLSITHWILIARKINKMQNTTWKTSHASAWDRGDRGDNLTRGFYFQKLYSISFTESNLNYISTLPDGSKRQQFLSATTKKKIQK